MRNWGQEASETFAVMTGKFYLINRLIDMSRQCPRQLLQLDLKACKER